MPPCSLSAARIATANPPARCSFGIATRLDTTTRRPSPRALIVGPSLRGFLPGAREAHGGTDQADVRIGLREIAPGLPVLEPEILRQQPQRIAPREHAFEKRTRFTGAADRRQRLDVPEGADREARFRRAEIV